MSRTETRQDFLIVDHTDNSGYSVKRYNNEKTLAANVIHVREVGAGLVAIEDLDEIRTKILEQRCERGTPYDIGITDAIEAFDKALAAFRSKFPEAGK